MDKRINPFAESVTPQAQPEHDQLVASSVASGAVGRLKESERNIINLYSQESLPFHTITLGFRELNEQEKAQGYHMGQGVELINALAQLPPYHGKTYRGAFVEKGFTYATAGVPVTRSMTTATARDGDRRAWQVGDYVTTKTFFSTSAAKGVAAEFIMRQRFGSAFYADTAILNIEGSSGRNITELTHIKQAEVLYPAYTVFRVSEVQKGEFGLEIGLQEVGEEIWHNPKAVIRDYRYGAIVKQRPAHMIPHRAA
ncbi:ADP-ribosyltransferase domain-containing protein [Trabulsiella odontotermitis]|uniref:ADP-ribosyltransferase domain-containing protein n=1 Tax=Trabulsiella odontotermitis TaxID=379893 RepID=UPI0012D75E1A